MEDIPLLYLDASKCEQVLDNLLTNVVKFSAPGSEVTIGCDQANDAVVLSVEISTGLGLAIVKRNVDGHGASISVRSEAGKGIRQ